MPCLVQFFVDCELFRGFSLVKGGVLTASVLYVRIGLVTCELKPEVHAGSDMQMFVVGS